MQIGILEPDGFSPRARERLATLGVVTGYAGGALSGFLADKEVLFVRLGRRLDEPFLAMTPRLRVVCSPTTGLTHVDLEVLRRRRIALLSLRGETAFLERIRATPEHTIGLVIALLRNYRTAFLDRSNDHWDRDRCRGEEINGLHVGVVGYGRVGRVVAGYLRAFGAHVGWYDPFIAAAVTADQRFESLAGLIESSRLVVLAASYEAGAPPLIDRTCIDALCGKYFVNIARGELADEEALLTAVENNRLAGCAVDVICDENGPNRRARWVAATRHANLIVTPHVGGATFTSMRATEEFVTEKLMTYLGSEGGAEAAGAG